MRLVLSVVLPCIATAATVFAQMQPRLAADIPIDFYLGDKAFPQGAYELTEQRPKGFVLLQSVTDTRISGAAAAHVASIVPAKYMPQVTTIRFSKLHRGVSMRSYHWRWASPEPNGST